MIDLFLPSGAVVARPMATRDSFLRERKNRALRCFLGDRSVESRRGRDTQSILQCGPCGALLRATKVRDAGDGLACASKPASHSRSNLFDKPGTTASDLCGTEPDEDSQSNPKSKRI